MSHWSEIFYFSIISAALLLSVVGLWFTAVMPGIDRWSKRFFLLYFIILMICCFSGFIELILNHYPVPYVAIYIVVFLELLSLSLPLPMLTAYMLHACGENIRSSRLLHTALGLLAVYFVVLASAPFNGVFSYATPDNQDYRGPLYALLLLPLIAILLLNLAGAIRRRAQMSHKAFISFVIAQVPMTAALLAMLFLDALPLFDISYVLAALAMYSFILSDQIEQNLRHQREIAQQQREIAHERASVMVLQMRPHFIYNTLMSIHSLCSLDPEKAQQITMDFTNYLRRNFTAVASDSTISFSTELEHTRAYLAVEQAQYDDMLAVDWDTTFTRFRLPPLTLQPIVENAVKHGMDLDSDPLRISIRTRHTDFGAEIIVEDNGPGFDPSDGSKPHTTLNTIRQRLEMMCGGKMTIAPRKEGGTMVTMAIPDNAAE
ncbi:MAG: histidine kinase [Clostridia bacterium]|nr:histidine kinase [Clostridia bacterium]